MRFGVLLLTVALGACGPSVQDMQNKMDLLNAQIAKEKSDLEKQNAEQARQQCENSADQKVQDNVNAIGNAVNLIKTTLDNVTRTAESGGNQAGFGWRIDIRNFSDSEWKWVEGEITAVSTDSGDTGALSDRIMYRLDPRKISPYIQAADYRGQPAIKMTCVNKGCIEVTGRRVVTVNGQQKLVDIDEVRDSNYWVLSTADRAEAMASTMTDLLQRYNFTRPNCSAGAAAISANEAVATNAM